MDQPGVTVATPATSRQIQLIATDIDGTILPYAQAHTGALSPRTLEAFRRARASGLEVVLVTGRPLRGVRGITSSLGPLGPVIASNGALTYDLAQEQVISASPLSHDVLFETIDLLRALDPTVNFAAETLDHVHMEEDFAKGSMWFEPERRRAAGIPDDVVAIGPLEETLKRYVEGDRRAPTGGLGENSSFGSDENSAASGTSASINKLGPGQVLKLLAKTHDSDPDGFIEAVENRIGHLVTVTHSAPGVSLVEISASGVTKASALRGHARRLNLAQESVAAFGDMPNDVDMLEWAGSSWAVSSGHPLAQAAADYRAGSCDDDGVAQVIEQLLDRDSQG